MIALNKDFKPIAEVDNFESLIWHEKYFTVGNFELHMGNEIIGMAYLYSKDFKEIGVIEEINMTENKIVYIGRFLKSLLDNKVINRTMIYNNKTPEFIVKDIVSNFALQHINVEPLQNLGTPITIQATGNNVLGFIDKLLETQELSSYIQYDYLTSKRIFKVFKGLDCTKTKAPLAKNFENIFNYSYNSTNKNVKNFAYVAGEEKENKKRTIIMVDLSNGVEKREIWVDARDLQREKYDDDGEMTLIPESEYVGMLKQRGLEKLSEYRIEETVNIEPNDIFEIGEKRVFKTSSIMTEQRVTEIITGIENNVIKRDIVFGLQKLTKSEAIKREVSK